ncbi:MAG: inositol monophosphatase [Bdellovibrionaceae bacterium]|nr:inositol monophosphatase [Pseudobdellovibrionaceae bacterium]|tara:strand:- start:32133 stop:32960 length:828 start_codon:yes stop_codon:yes gene_type:complete
MNSAQTPYNNQDLLDSARRAAMAGRKVLLDYFGNLTRVDEKHQAGLVSEADVTSEREIKAILGKDFPDIDFMGEEESFGKDANKIDKSTRTWVVDPLDGTTNYVHRFPIFCISIGLIIDGVNQVGVIDVPKMDKTYWAVNGEGAFCNGEPLKISGRKELGQSLMATGFFTTSEQQLNEQLTIFDNILHETPRGIRRAGSAAYDLCMVAEGIFDGYWERGLHPWDTCAGALLVKEAGGVVTNYEGVPFLPDMKSCLAGTPEIHSQMQSIIKKSIQS